MSRKTWADLSRRVVVAVAVFAASVGIVPIAPASTAAPVCSMACCKKAKACCCATSSHDESPSDGARGDTLGRPDLVQSCPEGCAQAQAPTSGGDRLVAASIPMTIDALPPPRAPSGRRAIHTESCPSCLRTRAPPSILS